MHKLAVTAAVIFFSFILWIIYLANTGSSSIFFELVKAIPYGDKLGHFCLFGVLTLIFNFATKFKTFAIAKYNVYLGSSAVTIFVIIEELSQGMIATRTLDFQDLMADSVGIIIFTYISYLISRYLNNEEK